MANVLVFSTWQLSNPPHFETDLEIIQSHLEKGDRVFMIGCNAEMPACDTNIWHDMARCLYCIGRRRKGIGLLSKGIELLPFFSLTDNDHLKIAALPSSFQAIEDLRKFKIDNHDIGLAVLSTLISKLRDPNPDLIKYHQQIRNMLMTSLAVYRTLINHLTAYNIDKVYVFNVRFAITRAVFRACQSKHVECITHDRGHDIHHYQLVNNSMLHDGKNMQENILKSWNTEVDVKKKSEIASQWFLDRAEGKEQSWKSFVVDQDPDQLPEDWDVQKTNVVIFNSSEDEFAAVGQEWLNPLYQDQLEGLSKVIESLKYLKNVQLYLRVHPNLLDIKNEQTASIKRLQSPNLTVIPADSSVSSYQLVKNASKVITFGSTVGIEAVYWGTPSILAGQSFYRELGGTYNPGSHEELINMVLDKNLKPKPREAALVFGYYLNTFGIPFRHYQASGVFKGRYNGRRVTPGLHYWAGIAGLMALPPLRQALSRRSTKRKLAMLEGKTL